MEHSHCRQPSAVCRQISGYFIIVWHILKVIFAVFFLNLNSYELFTWPMQLDLFHCLTASLTWSSWKQWLYCVALWTQYDVSVTMTPDLTGKSWYHQSAFKTMSDSLIREMDDNWKQCMMKIQPFQLLQPPLTVPPQSVLQLVDMLLQKWPDCHARAIFPLVYQSYRVMLTAPAAVETNERIFSRLKTVARKPRMAELKTYCYWLVKRYYWPTSVTGLRSWCVGYCERQKNFAML